MNFQATPSSSGIILSSVVLNSIKEDHANGGTEDFLSSVSSFNANGVHEECVHYTKAPKHRKVSAVIIGAGNRGKNYAGYALEFPDLFEIVAVAEPREQARKSIQVTHALLDENCFEGWEALVKKKKFADCALVCTKDQDHVGPSVALAKLGYHILLEKPMASTEEDCRLIYETCQETKVLLAVCHMLRYHPPVKKLKELIDSDIIGDVVNINQIEPIGFFHFAHSYVRGNWRNTESSTFSLLAKCCHDVDLIAFLMGSQKCVKVSSFGSLHHFRKENKPAGASSRCLECKVEALCPYSAKKVYLDPKPSKPRWPMNAVCDIEDPPEAYLTRLTESVRTGRYGKCVYGADNNVCDNQVVNFEFSDGATATLTMIAFSEHVCEKKAQIYGTRGQLMWDEAKGHVVEHYDFLTKTTKIHTCEMSPPGWDHAGADYYMMKAFVEAVATGNNSLIVTGPKVSLETHLLTFAAEHSRTSGKIVNTNKDPRWIVN
ncbi:hypothetical protein SK128_015738 [Halocaridina rubra]|uniref:Oxidoreductase n=1 Tax=Halocaridina rubra TaxID=373956 RepID=A0AAN8X3D0_HALRR